MRLSKPHVDVGLIARNTEAMLAFWQNEVGLPFEELLPTGHGNHQHRHAMNGSVLKLNVTREPTPETPATGYRELWIAEEATDAPRPLIDPDGNLVARVPVGHEGVSGIGLRVGVRSVEAHARFYQEALGFEAVDEATFRCGDTLFFLDPDPEACNDSTLLGPGYRYVTIQVFDCDAATAFALERGARLAAPARTLGNVARFSMIRDPDGNWIELSQRRSLTGDLPA